MYLLGYESVLRQAIGFPGVDSLWGGKSCIWKRHRFDVDSTVAKLRFSPAEACADLELDNERAIRLFDELMVHAKFGAALDLALYLGSAPDILCLGLRRIKGVHCYDPRTVILLKHLGAKAALAGGIYERARALLQQSDRVLKDVADLKNAYWLLLAANQNLLRGRLEQLLWLSDRSFDSFRRTRQFFAEAGYSVPPGLDLLEHRSKVAGPPTGSHHIPALTTPVRTKGDNLYGGLADHYFYYLCGRGALHSRNWSVAQQHLDRASTYLKRDGHAGLVDPIRLGNVIMCQGRALAGKGLAIGGATAEVEQGILLLHKAREIFKTNDFPPGEYKAYTDYIQVRAGLDEKLRNIRPVGQRLPMLKEAVRISRKTSVPVFRVASGIEHADTLRRAGRMNRAQIVIEDVRRIDRTALLNELSGTEMADKVDALEKVTARARQNSVEPLEPWGLSDYAVEEQAFVERASRSEALISASGPPGSGRRLQIARVQEARRQRSGLWEINSSVPSDRIVDELRAKVKDKQCVLLSAIDQWPIPSQQQVASVLREEERWHRYVYATIRSWMTGVRTLDPGLVRFFSDWHLEVKPLCDREEDVLMLARGFLVRSIIAEPPLRVRPEDRIQEPRDLILSGSACDFVRRHFTTVGEIYRAMRYLATRLRASRDVITIQHRRAIVTVEAMERHLPSPGRRSDLESGATGGTASAAPPSAIGPEVKSADVALIQALANQYPSLAALAEAAGIERTTLIEAWKKRGVKHVWDDARSQAQRSRRRTRA